MHRIKNLPLDNSTCNRLYFDDFSVNDYFTGAIILALGLKWFFKNQQPLAAASLLDKADQFEFILLHMQLFKMRVVLLPYDQ